MKLAAIHHVVIIVSDYEKSKDFYVNACYDAALQHCGGHWTRPANCRGLDG